METQVGVELPPVRDSAVRFKVEGAVRVRRGIAGTVVADAATGITDGASTTTSSSSLKNAV